MARKRAKPIPPKRRAEILKTAEQTSPTEAARIHKVPVRLIWSWRAKGYTSTSNTPTKQTQKRHAKKNEAKKSAKKTRRTFTDAQKRLILRVAQDEGTAVARARYNVTSGLIAKWKKKYRPARSKVSKSRRKSTRTRNGAATNGQHESTKDTQTVWLKHLQKEVEELRSTNSELSAQVKQLRKLAVDQALQIQSLSASN